MRIQLLNLGLDLSIILDVDLEYIGLLIGLDAGFSIKGGGFFLRLGLGGNLGLVLFTIYFLVDIEDENDNKS